MDKKHVMVILIAYRNRALSLKKAIFAKKPAFTTMPNGGACASV
jgi:hypothetical protein